MVPQKVLWRPLIFISAQLSEMHATLRVKSDDSNKLWWEKIWTRICMFLSHSKTAEIGKVYIAWKVSKCGVFSSTYFPVFGLNTEIYTEIRIQFEYWKIRTRKNSLLGPLSVKFLMLCFPQKSNLIGRITKFFTHDFLSAKVYFSELQVNQCWQRHTQGFYSIWSIETICNFYHFFSRYKDCWSV